MRLPSKLGRSAEGKIRTPDTQLTAMYTWECNNVRAGDVTLHMLVAILILILATLVAGPIGFLVVGALLLTWALVTGTLHLVLELLLLPFRAFGALARGRR